MQSSSQYTFRPVKTKKTGEKTTFLLGAVSVAAGVVFGINANGGFAALFPASSTGTSPISSGTTPVNTTATADGDAINYQFGTVQVSVTRKNGKLTAVDLVQATASAGRDQAFSMLQSAAISANGTNFGNISGATYTTDAFKQALDSAIAKLP